MKRHGTFRVTAISVVLAVTGCAEPPSWTILVDAPIETVTGQCTRPSPPGDYDLWTPTAADVAHAESQLPHLLETMIARAPEEQRPEVPQSYIRQYIGVVRKGERLLYVNALSRELMSLAFENAWRHQVVGVCDGGTYAFGAIFNLSKNRFEWFSFNDMPGFDGMPVELTYADS